MTITAAQTQVLANDDVEYLIESNAKTSSVMRISSHDVDEQAEYLTRWDQRYVQVSPGPFKGRLLEAWFGEIQFLRETTNQAIHETGRSWADSRTFCIPLEMSGDSWFRGMLWHPDTCAIMGGDVDLDLRTGRSLDVIGITLNFQRLVELAEQNELSTNDLGRWLSGGCIARITPQKVLVLRKMLVEVALLVEQQSVLLSHSSVCKSIENAIYENIFGLLIEAVDVRTSPTMYLPRRQLVRRAIEFVSEHADRVVTIGELCQVLRVSRRTLQEYFEYVLHVSPIQYLRAYRLNKVRAALRNEESLRVRDAAAQFGFWNLSQFSQDYKRLFGELPSHTSNPIRRSN